MKLLLPVDGSDVSLAAVDYAVKMARGGLRAELVLVNVQDTATLYELVTLHDREALAKVALEAGMDLLAEAVERVDAAGVPCVQTVVVGDAVSQLLEAIEDHGCEGVVMGYRGRGLALGGLGSVAQALLERSGVPVTLVKPNEPASDESTDA